jgi:hypothetical protein
MSLRSSLVYIAMVIQAITGLQGSAFGKLWLFCAGIPEMMGGNEMKSDKTTHTSIEA